MVAWKVEKVLASCATQLEVKPMIIGATEKY